MVLIEKGEGVIVTAPVVRAEIPGGRVQISGSMNTEEQGYFTVTSFRSTSCSYEYN